MKKYLLLLFAFFALDIFLHVRLGASTSDHLKFEQWYLMLIFFEIPIYGTLILYEIKKDKGEDKK